MIEIEPPTSKKKKCILISIRLRVFLESSLNKNEAFKQQFFFKSVQMDPKLKENVFECYSLIFLYFHDIYITLLYGSYCKTTASGYQKSLH